VSVMSPSGHTLNYCDCSLIIVLRISDAVKKVMHTEGNLMWFICSYTIPVLTCE
jgi:hypothetical protein